MLSSIPQTSLRTIWAGSPVPAAPDYGPDSPVELGVQFKADASGVISAVRFYKASTNIGPRVVNLWSSTGTLLGTATSSSETASGWQQVNFPSPVAITANTIYVASYHTSVGHWSVDRNYFAFGGVDNVPVHAPMSGSNGVLNGVYAYGSSSLFPNQSYQASNYWVDVVFNPNTTTAPLTAIAVTPTNPTITVGSTQQFTATGTYQDNSTQNITSQVTWSSSNTTVATIATTGLATGQNAGTAAIQASQGGISGSTVLTVNLPPSLTLSSLTLNPTSVTGGNFSLGTVTLSGAAPSGSAVVSLSSSDTTAATVPSSVTVAPGATSATFTVSTSAVTSSTPVTISASYSGTSQSAALTVQPPLPQAPTGLTATAGPGAKKISLSWTGSSLVTTYNVKRSITSGGSYTTVATGVATTTYTDIGLISGATYYYAVSAVNSTGESADSNQASARAK